MKKKILLGTSSFGKKDPSPIQYMTDRGYEVIPNPHGRKLTKPELMELLAGVDGLLAGLETIDREVLASSTLRAVSRCGSGISNVDVDACKELGIAFSFTPFGPTQAVAELTVGMILSLLRQSFAMHASLSQGKWDKRVGFQLKGKTVCIVGYGRIGQCTAGLLQAFNVDIIAVDPFAEASAGLRVMELHDALPISDLVILHLAGEDLIMGAPEFALMKEGAYLCNAARGKNVDEAALFAAFNSEKLAGAWLDSFSTEPYIGPLCGHPKVLMTPHVGSYTAEGRRDMEMEAARNMVTDLDKPSTGSRP